MFPLDSNVRLLPELKKRGFRLYYLSNFPLDIFEEVKTGYYFFKYFDGGLISAEAKFSKPDAALYKILLEKYSLVYGFTTKIAGDFRYDKKKELAKLFKVDPKKIITMSQVHGKKIVEINQKKTLRQIIME